ncbi:acyl-CoA dehydrogenase [Lentzea sp. NBRC 105346]|uniref:acyl-CoA dehydrogenase family protein n=1 Tax=Lentzea sp. NBRC 105346 TaxID=3032205 RepID=UPI0024A28729|nr:acyl-CoA dehydrogenase family protein [Lentzea sp. NBRC 105346]GLZ28619.1 acyl-CoA dehydrogenase [Lentzea sp. NBRC 105346]
MPIATTDEQRAAQSSLREWAAKADPVHWPDLARLGIFSVTRDGGTITDLAAMLEQTATDLVPGPVLTTALAGVVLADHPIAEQIADGSVTVGLGLNGPRYVLGDAPHVLLRTDDGWFLARATPTPLDAVDLTRPLTHVGEVVTDHEIADPTDLAMTLFAAEASGIAAWCLHTATEYARHRVQFGRPIGSFQAVKHLCVEMLCRVEQASAVAWAAARAADESSNELPLAAAVAAAVALDAAVENAKDCIQVLGGIGFTWEHDAHRYLRRALALRQHAGGSAKWRRRVAELTLAGARRSLRVEIDGHDAERAAAREFAEEITRLPKKEQRIRLAESGYLVPHWPKPYGLDASPAHQLVIDDELADVHRPDLIIGAWAAPTILNHGTPEQQERFVRPTLRGEITWCQLFSEPEAGSDLASLRTKATKTEGGWLLTGQKVWTSLAHEADWAICLARTDPEAPKHKGITYFLVDMRTAGIDVRPLREITGEARFNEVFLDNVFVPDECVVGEVNGGWRLARTTLANERVAMGRGSSLGEGLERVLELEAARDPDTSERIGALVAEGLAGSVLELRAGLRALSGQDPGAESSVRKLVGVRHRQAVAEFGVELLGLEATADHPLVHEFLLTRCLSIAGGTTQVLLNLAGERILGLPRES